MPEKLKENCLKIDCIHYSDYNGKCYKKENLEKAIRQCGDSGRNAVLADVLALTPEEILSIASVFDIKGYGIGLEFKDGYRVGVQRGMQYIIERLKGQVC